MGKVVVSGVGGFVGRAVASRLHHNGAVVQGLCRSSIESDFSTYVLPSFSDVDTLKQAFAGADAVVHCAARAHVVKDSAADPLSVYRDVNRDLALLLAKTAAETGVRRFVFLSSANVNQESNLGRSVSKRLDPCSLAKREAEQGLQQIALSTGLEVVIIRPPLVYGPGAKGNFASLIKLVEKGLPLPFGAIHNKRSFLGLDNLVDLIITCLDHPAAANEIFQVADDEDLSTSDLLRRMAEAMRKPLRLIPVPSGLLFLGAVLIGKRAMAQRLLATFQVDISKTRSLLGWSPPFSVDEGLRRCFAENWEG